MKDPLCTGCKWSGNAKVCQACKKERKKVTPSPGPDKVGKKDINLLKPAKRSKHGNSKVVDEDGRKFDSKREMARWKELIRLECAGAISGLSRQVAYELVPSVVLDGRKKPCVRYLVDFEYTKNGVKVLEDAKSPHLRKDPTYRLKKHLVKHVYNLDIIEI